MGRVMQSSSLLLPKNLCPPELENEHLVGSSSVLVSDLISATLCLWLR